MSDHPFKSRKIKFKAWDTESGLLLRLDSIDCNKGELVKKNHILLQFTGIVDKNGAEIYDMDVLLVANEKFVVFWNEEKNGWYHYALKNPKDRKVFLTGSADAMIRLGNLFELENELTPDKFRKK